MLLNRLPIINSIMQILRFANRKLCVHVSFIFHLYHSTSPPKSLIYEIEFLNTIYGHCMNETAYNLQYMILFILFSFTQRIAIGLIWLQWKWRKNRCIFIDTLTPEGTEFIFWIHKFVLSDNLPVAIFGIIQINYQCSQPNKPKTCKLL